MQTVAGHCGKCGAPYYAESVWHGITPPPLTPSCVCWNTPQYVTTTETTQGTDLAPYNGIVLRKKGQ